MKDELTTTLTFNEAHLVVTALEHYATDKRHLDRFPAVARAIAEKLRNSIAEAFRKAEGDA